MYPTRSFRLLEYHGNMLSDRVRVEAFARALRALVPAGGRVLDIGTGTGILALLAARAGARHVDAVEVGEVLELARAIVEANGAQEQVHLHRALSYQLGLAERADLLVTETLGNFGLEEGILGTVLDARFRLLRPGAPVIPRVVELFVHPVSVPETERKVSVWSGDVEGVHLSAVGAQAAHLLWYVRIEPGEALGPLASLGAVDLQTHDRPSFEGRTTLTIERPGRLSGLGGTYRATLAEDIALSNAPGEGAESAPSWRQTLLPLPEPWPVEPGMQFEAEVSTWDNGEHWRWRVWGEGREAEMSTLQGYRSSLSGVF